MRDPRAKPHEPAARKWMASAVSNPGYLHRVTNTPADERIPPIKLAEAKHSSNLHERRAANLASTFAHHRP